MNKVFRVKKKNIKVSKSIEKFIFICFSNFSFSTKVKSISILDWYSFGRSILQIKIKKKIQTYSLNYKQFKFAFY